MTAVLVHARAGLRHRRRGWLGIAVVVGLAAGIVIACAAGARRTDSAYPRFVRAQHAADLFLFTQPGAPPTEADVARLPGVSAVASGYGPFAPVDSDIVPVVLTDQLLGRTVNRFKFVAGAGLRPGRGDETVVSFVLARQRHLHVGSRLMLHAPGPTPGSIAAAIPLRVVGIEAAPDEFPPLSGTNRPIYLSPAFLADHPELGKSDQSVTELAVRLQGGPRDASKFQAALQTTVGQPVGAEVLADQAANVQRSMHLQALALWLMAGFAGATAIVTMLQLLTRQMAESSDDDDVARSLGMTSTDLLASAFVRVMPVAVVGAAIACVVAVSGSAVFPLGTARIAEPHTGVAVDATAITLGALMTAVIVVALGLVGWWRARRALAPAPPARSATPLVSRAMGQTPLPVAAAVGVRFAFSPGRGRTAVPVRSALGAAGVGIAAMAAAVTFGASLTHLLATPRLYGVTYGAHIESNGNNQDARTLVEDLRADPRISAALLAEDGIPLQSGRVHFGAQAGEYVKGSLPPTVLTGRAPTGPDEILLGSRTMGELHAHVGSVIPVAVAGITGPLPMRVVGSGVIAPSTVTEQLGRGALLAPTVIARFTAAVREGFQIPPPGDVFVSFRRGVSAARARDAIQRRLGTAWLVSAPTQPTDIANFGQVRNLPILLAALLAVVAAATLVYLLVTAVRRRRRDLAVFKTLGLVPGQLSVLVAWNATAVTMASLLVGIPVGVIAGRWTWTYVADQIGFVARPAVPLTLVLVFIPLAVAIANIAAAGPAIAASRIGPATVLRAE